MEFVLEGKKLKKKVIVKESAVINYENLNWDELKSVETG